MLSTRLESLVRERCLPDAQALDDLAVSEDCISLAGILDLVPLKLDSGLTGHSRLERYLLLCHGSSVDVEAAGKKRQA